MLKIFIASSILYAAVSAGLSDINTCYDDPASLQLPNYKKKSKCPLKCLTTSFGARVHEEDLTVLNDENLMRDRFFLESLRHRMRERIPERYVHTKGAGAFGYFEVTNNITHCCKAKLFNKIGKRTRIAVRFSHANLDKGEADTTLDIRGFAAKFYTEDGNFDLLGLNLPIFSYKEPFLFHPLVGNVLKRNPVTNLRDENMRWDLICNRPESLNFFLYLFGVTGVTDGFVCMPGFPINTYQVYNAKGEIFFVKWHMIPSCKTKRLSLAEATEIACKDPDYYVRQLYNAIANGNYPTYTLGIQVITQKEIDANPKFDYFDVTKFWPESEYPVLEVGKMVLNQNPVNYFTDVEQIAFCPGNFPEGVLGAPDNLFTARIFAYKETQVYRLSTNSDNIAVNRPVTEVHNYDRDGEPPVGENGRDGPNYLFNGYKGPTACAEENRPKLITIKQVDDAYNFDQIAALYKNMTQEQKNEMAHTIVYTLRKTYKKLQDRVLNLLGCVDNDLKFRVTVELSNAADKCSSWKKL